MRCFAIAGLLLSGCAMAVAGPVDARKVDETFRAGLAAAGAGRHDVAIRHYGVALASTSAPRIRLELARSLLLSGRYDEARQLFKQVYEEKTTPLAVRRNILPLLEEAELRVMRIRFGVRMITDSNPARVSDGATIFFNGFPLQYQPPQSKKVTYGVEPYATVEKLWQTGMLTRFSTSARLFEDEDLNSARFGLAVGRKLNGWKDVYVQASMETELRHTGSYALPSVEAWKRITLSDRSRLGFGGQIGMLVSENSDMTGGYYRPYVFADWTFLPNTTLFGKFSTEYLDSRNGYYSYAAPRLDLGLDLRFADFNVTPQISVTRTSFRQFDPFWGTTRRDTTIRPSLTLSHDRIEYSGLKPELLLFYETRDSNVPINEYRQFGGYLNLKRIY